jgi:hypothetical protein
VEYEGRQPHQNSGQGHGNGLGDQHLGIGCSLRPGTVTVLVASMDQPDGPSVYLSLADVVLLRRELGAAFGRSDSTASRGQGEVL